MCASGTARSLAQGPRAAFSRAFPFHASESRRVRVFAGAAQLGSDLLTVWAYTGKFACLGRVPGPGLLTTLTIPASAFFDLDRLPQSIRANVNNAPLWRLPVRIPDPVV